MSSNNIENFEEDGDYLLQNNVITEACTLQEKYSNFSSTCDHYLDTLDTLGYFTDMPFQREVAFHN
ncbi:hypothetical protein T01_14625 [Trichinella spiralis]|uniref:Uncharacterized protein n=1 Tax=Trichinella spiralis TaxID=6334 RepID=A0A0V1BSX5_TRISP|nr:hypothetical protein T01_14625 [Trichinella spiralis]